MTPGLPGSGTAGPDCAATCAAVGLSAHLAAFAPWWEGAGSGPNDDGALTPAGVRQLGREVDLPEPVLTDLVVGLDLFDRHPPLRLLAARLGRACVQQADRRQELPALPELPGDLHPAAGLFYAYVILVAYPGIGVRNRARGIPEAITRAGFADLGRWLADHRQVHGWPGFTQFAWMRRHLQGTLVELGRLQFEQATWTAPALALRRRDTGGITLLLADGQALDAEGRLQGHGGGPSTPGGFTTRLARTGAGWRGHPIDAQACGARMPADFPDTDWQTVLAPGDPVLAVHIPAGPGLTPAACAAACADALAFQAVHAPGHPVRAFTCTSWLCDPRLAAGLPPESQVVRFQRAFHLHPFPDPDGTQILERVLGSRQADPHTFVPRTTLQRVVVDHLRRGGRWAMHGGVLFPEELPRAFTG